MRLSCDQLKEIVEELLKDTESENFIETICRLKKEFQEMVNDLLKDKGEDAKVVIFVDDLDRLQPSRAVELLEILKIFLDCENCVYVLAIDYEVVVQGIMEKYPRGMTEKKAKSFFDKIIQVPFMVPVAKYELKDYLDSIFKEFNIEGEYAKKCRKLIKYSVGGQP